MAKFEALDDLFDDALELPIPGRDGTKRTYRIPSPPAEDGLLVVKVTTLATKLMAGGTPTDAEMLDDSEERDLIGMALGPAAAEMSEDGVDWAWTRHAGLTAVLWIARGIEDAEAYWRAAGSARGRGSGSGCWACSLPTPAFRGTSHPRVRGAGRGLSWRSPSAS
jgi:hypothetical protein